MASHLQQCLTVAHNSMALKELLSPVPSPTVARQLIGVLYNTSVYAQFYVVHAHRCAVTVRVIPPLRNWFQMGWEIGRVKGNSAEIAIAMGGE